MKNKSLKIRLLIILMSSLFVAWIATLATGYLLTQKTLNQQLDLKLKQLAQSLLEVTTRETIEIRRNHAVAGHEEDVEYQILRNEKMVTYSEHAPRELLSQDEGYSQNNVEDKKWRVFSARNDNSRILVGQDLDVRKSLIRGMILSSLWPMAVALPLIALVLWFAVTVGLKPLDELASAIRKSTPKKLGRINLNNVPSELILVVQSLNSLLESLESTLDREKQFTDNAAHELRTPLAAIKTQAQLALRSKDEREKTESILAVNQGVDRASKMVTQLMTLARLDPASLELSFSSVNLNDLGTRVIAQLVPQALIKKIDIGLLESEQVSVHGNRDYLEIMISNLVDNAIRYSPQFGVIDLQIYKVGSEAVLSIEDQGPGIPEKDRERVFDRFVRLAGGETDGSGIGLAIVRKILILHQARIELGTPEKNSGLIVRVIFNLETIIRTERCE